MLNKRVTAARALLGIAVFSLLILSSGTLELFKDGGARDQGVINRIEYHGILNYVTWGWSLLAGGALFLHAYTRGTINVSRAKLPLALVAFAAFSCLWSPELLASLKAAILVVLGAVTVIIFTSEGTTAKLFEFLAYALLPLIIASLLAVFFVPAYGVSVGTHEGAWQGIFDHKNGLGSFCAIALSVYLGWRRGGGPRWVYIPALACVILAAGSLSFTGATAAALIFAIHIISSSKLTVVTLRRMAPAVVIVGVSLPVLITLLPVLGTGIEIAGKGALFSGRGYIWSYLLQDVASSPILGNGFNAYKNSVYAGGNETALLAAIGFLPGSAHNGFLETFHSMGLVGLALAMAVVLAPVAFTRRSPYFMAMLYAAVCAIVINCFESRLVSFNNFFFALIYLHSLAGREKGSKYD